MNKEISKPNDIFVSTLVNGNVGVLDLIGNGITASNTLLLNPETYKESNYVKKAFSDEKGVFHEDKFLQAYEVAAKQYQELVDAKTYENLEKYIEYNQNDIFAPLESKKASVSYEITPELNPTKRSHGVSSLFEYGKASQSMRELAQLSKIWDSENQVWLDKTANDRGIFGSLFGQTLVYATWDEDGEHEDLLTGRKIKHKKGDWKLNEKGQYYTETLGDRPSHGKQFVAASDTLTKEGSALNKIDVFDSDDLEKSVVGTTVKAMLKFAPYLFPQTQMVWGGVTAALEMAKVLPRFMKVGEGIIMGGDAEDESSFTRAMNRLENYFSKFENSRSDRGMDSNWSYEAITDTLTDVVAQLYQMRAAASLSRLAVKDPTQKAILKFLKEIFPAEIWKAKVNGLPIPEYTSKELAEMAYTAAQKMPEIKKIIEAQSKLSKAISSGYMALSSTSDVFADALAGGYDRRTAGLAALTAAAGQYAIMNTTSLGEWMLDKNVGYSEHANRATILKALRPYYDDIAKSIDSINKAGVKQEKEKILGKVIGKLRKGIDTAWDSIKEDGSVYWRNALTESIEEVTEEGVLDATKGIFDLLTWAGFGKNRDASFGVAQDFTSGSFLERYAQSAFGGFLGGALFELQQKKIEPMMRKAFYGLTAQDIQPSLVHEIVNGRTQDIYRAIDELIELDNESAAVATDVNGNAYFASANGGMTRGLAVGNVLKQYVSVLEGVLIDENAHLTDDQVVQKTIRDHQAIKLIKEGGLDKLLITDFAKLASEIASIRLTLAQKEKDKESKADAKPKEEDKKESSENTENKESIKFDGSNYNALSESELNKLLKEKRKELDNFFDGKKGEAILYKTLSGATPEIKDAVGLISLYKYTYLKYGKEYKDLDSSGTVTKKSVEEEYNKWKKETNAVKRFLTLGADAFGDFDSRFSEYVVDYVKSRYAEARNISYEKVYSNKNFEIDSLLNEEKAYNLIKHLSNTLKGDLREVEDSNGNKITPELKGEITLLDIFRQDTLKLKGVLTSIVDANPESVKLLQATGRTKTDIIDRLALFVLNFLETTTVDNLHGTSLSGLIEVFFHNSIQEAFGKILSKVPNPTLGSVQQWLLENGYINAPIEIDPQKLANTDLAYMQEQFTKRFTFNPASSDSVGLSTSLLWEYLLTEDTIDGVVSQRIEEFALDLILVKLTSISPKLANTRICTMFDEMEDHRISYFLHEGFAKEVLDSVNNNFGTKPLDKIITETVSEAVSTIITEIQGLLNEGYVLVGSEFGLTEDVIADPVKVTEAITSTIMSELKSVPAYQLWSKLLGKQIKQNPIYESLEKIEEHLSESGPSKVLEVLKNQHHKLRKAERFEDYMPKGEERIQLERALDTIEMYKALLVAMSNGPVGLGRPFAVNQQMRRWLEKNNIKSDRKYEVVDQSAIELIKMDLDLIEQQIKGYLKLGERAYTGKKEEDIRIKKQFSQLILKYINDNASAFTIDDFSLLPPDKDKTRFKEPEELVAFYAHAIYQNFHLKFKTAEEKAAAIKHIMSKLGIKGKLNRSSKPTNLSGDIKSLSEYDKMLWIATALGADQNEFYFRYNLMFVGSDKSKLVPLYGQEIAALQAWSFLRGENSVRGKNGDMISIHEAILDECLEEGKGYITASLVFTTTGITGAGKSNAVSRIVSRLCSDKLQYITAANTSQKDNYVKSISLGHPEKEYLQHGTVWELLGRFLTKDGREKLKNQIKFSRNHNGDLYTQSFTDHFFIKKPLQYMANGQMKEGGLWVLDTAVLDKILKDDIDRRTLPEIIFIDEFTQVDTWTIQVLNYLGKKYGFKINLAGDPVQRGIPQFGDTQTFKDLFGWKSAKLNVSVRASNNQKGNNNIAFNKQLEVYEEKVTIDPSEGHREFDEYLALASNQEVISYYQDEETFTGDKFVESLDKAKEDLKHIAKLNKKSKSKAIIVTKLDDNNQPVNSNLVPMLQEAGFDASDYEFYSYEDIHDKAVQGHESNYVIVDNSYLSASVKHTGELLRSVYTFASRSLKGTLMVLPLEQLKKVGIINRKDKFTQIDEIPQLAEIEKIKEERKKMLDHLLSDYTPKQIELDKLKTEEINGKKVAVRKSSIAPQASKPKKTTVESEEETFTEEELNEVNTALNSVVNTEPVNPLEADATAEDKKKNAERINLSVSKYDETYDPNKPVRCYSALDHLGVPNYGDRTDMWDPREDMRTCLDLDGLVESKRAVYPNIRTGFIRFRNTLFAAKSKEDIVAAIKDDKYIAAFLQEVAPMVLVRAGYSPETDWNSEDKIVGRIYAAWFKDSVDIDDNYYVFAKKLDWKRDKPTNTKNANKEQSVQDGNTVLYFGLKLKSREPDDASDPNPLLHQYISIGTLSDRKYKDKKDGVTKETNSRELQTLYKKADEDLNTVPAPPIAVYKLPNCKLYDTKLATTMWIKSLENVDDIGSFETLSEIERRGFIVDRENIYLVDSSKINIGGGQMEYKALVLAALLGYTAGDIDPEHYTQLTFEQKLDRLRKAFVDSHTGELRISGSYMAIAQSTLMGPTNSSLLPAYQRIVFFNPKKSNIVDVFKRLDYDPSQVTDKSIFAPRTKLDLCRPASLTDVIVDILDQIGVFSKPDTGFDYNQIFNLLKYLEGWRNRLRTVIGEHNKYASDLTTLNELIAFVEGRMATSQMVTKDDFLAKFRSLHHRVLLMPFFLEFIRYDKNTKKWGVLNIKSFEALTTVNGVRKYNIAGFNTANVIQLDIDRIPECYACPPLVKGSDTQPDLVLQFIEEGRLIMPKGAPLDLDKITMFRIPDDYDRLGTTLGMYNYELQSPVFVISNNELKDFEQVKHPYLIKAEGEARWPSREIHYNIPQKPENWDPTLYKPEIMSDTPENFVAGDDYKPYVEMHMKTKLEKKNGKWVDVVKIKYQKKTADGWQDTTKAVYDKYSKKNPKGYRKVSEKDQYEAGLKAYVRITPNGKMYHTAVNKQGFEVRIGDIVLLWGDPSVTVRISNINKSDPEHIKIRIDAIGGPDGAVQKMSREREIDIEAVTKMVRRRVYKKEHAKDDYYVKGLWRIDNPLARGKYAQLTKSSETMKEIVNDVASGSYNKTLDFDSYIYMAVPIGEVPSVDSFTYLSLPYGTTAAPRVQHTKIENVEELKTFIQEKELQYASSPDSILGYTLYKLSREKVNGKYNGDITAAFNTAVNRIEEAVMKAHTSEYIAHHVFFNPALVDSVQQGIEMAAPATFYEHTKVAAKFVKPSEIPLHPEKTFNMDAFLSFKAKGLTFTETLWLERGKSFPNTEFAVEYDPITHQYIAYPNDVFYFKTNKSTDEDEKSNKKKKRKKKEDQSAEPAKYIYTSRDNDAIIMDDWIKTVYFAPLTPSELAKHWSDLLTGLMFTDRQFAAFDKYYFEDKEAFKPLTETEKSLEWAKRTAAKRTLNPLGAKTDHSADELKNITITKVLNIDGKLTVYYSSGRADGKEQLMELTHFLIAMGSRFIPIGKSESASSSTPEPVVAPSAPVITITTVSGETVGTTATEGEDSTDEVEDNTEVKLISKDIVTSKFGGNTLNAILDFLNLDKAPSKISPINAKIKIITQILAADYELKHSIIEQLDNLITSDPVSGKNKLSFGKISQFIETLSQSERTAFIGNLLNVDKYTDENIDDFRADVRKAVIMKDKTKLC